MGTFIVALGVLVVLLLAYRASAWSVTIGSEQIRVEGLNIFNGKPIPASLKPTYSLNRVLSVRECQNPGFLWFIGRGLASAFTEDAVFSGNEPTILEVNLVGKQTIYLPGELADELMHALPHGIRFTRLA